VKHKHNERRMGLLLAPDSVTVELSNCVFRVSFAVALAVFRREFRYVSCDWKSTNINEMCLCPLAK